MGGSTFAMWSANETVGSHTINHGELSMATSGDAVAYDLRGTGDETITGADGEEITLADFKAVPGDQLEIDLPVSLTAVGDNMRYQLYLKATSTDVTVDAHWKFSVLLVDANDQVTTVVFNAGGAEKITADGLAVGSPQTVSGDVKVAILAELPSDVTLRNGTSNSASLAGLSISAVQVDIA
jgi:alternate signal-mediated exported protein